MRVILSEAKDLTFDAGITLVNLRDQWRLRAVPRRLRGSG
jgi:hypothetical protein